MNYKQINHNEKLKNEFNDSIKFIIVIILIENKIQ